jgi:hypothetical protein
VALAFVLAGTSLGYRTYRRLLAVMNMEAISEHKYRMLL